MKILAIESSAVSASAAITDGSKIIASSYVNVKLPHSQTLMPMIRSALDSSLTDINSIDAIAVSCGPGSFTGIRIGISAAKGLAVPKDLPCLAVSTLYCMAQNFAGSDCIVCAVMDARCNQVYNALFRINGLAIERLCDDRALLCDDLVCELQKYKDKNIVICGDGADMFIKYVSKFSNIKIAPEHLKYQNAVGVALCGYEMLKSGKTVSKEELLPVYLRLPQAERELKAKKQKLQEL